ncbi:MAG TPA: hypothetical protein VFC82_07170 [Actinomycetaceae bacterium]|nr:hypothetical protein [Actinomycetaceae bacterium]
MREGAQSAQPFPHRVIADRRREPLRPATRDRNTRTERRIVTGEIDFKMSGYWGVL